MKQSLTYYLTLFVLKLKGVKKNFSQDPIDFKKVRKEDIQQPKGNFFKQSDIRNFSILKTDITEVALNSDAKKLVIFIHGGAFICGPAKHHWDTIKTIAQSTNQTIWMCNYPKAPEHKISEISKNIDAIYAAALKDYDASQISLIGDSVGATLIAALMQRLVLTKGAAPHKIILVSPVMDASLTNPEIDTIDKIDPMLGKKGVLSAKKLCAENDDLSNPMISPLNGSFENFPQTVLFLAEHDITYPDQKLMVEKLKAAGVELEIIIGKNMPHIWPFLPVMKEAKTALQQVIDRLKI